MFIAISLFFLGFYVLIKGSGWVTEGASALAKKLNVSTWVIGLLIVGIGTSIPEFSIAAISNIMGGGEIALGTVIGSNTFNIFFILGAAALASPLTFKKNWIKHDLVWNIFAVLIAFYAGFYSFGGNKEFLITRTEGFIMLVLFCVWIYFSLKKPDDNTIDGSSNRALTLPIILLMIFIGLVGVLLGGKWIVDGAVEIARSLAVSEKLIGLTIIGIGTSIPELAISLSAAYKKQFSIAVGGIIGSNIFDFLMILGFSAILSPIAFSSEFYVDIWITLLAAIALMASMFIGKKAALTRAKGAVFILIYLAYITYLAIRG